MVLPKIITISGVDGSGKTTISRLIKTHLQEKKLKVRVCHTGSLLKTSSDPQKKMYPIMGLISFVKDYLQIIVQYFSCLGIYDYVIFDRFLYDSIVKISYKQELHYIQSFYIFMTKFLFPIPHLSFLLLAPPFISKIRDNEHSKTYHTHKFKLYKMLPHHFQSTVIQSEKPLKVVFRQVKQHL